jgi:hypothetical protein
MAKKTSPVPSLVVYPLAAVGLLAIYLHYWGRKLGAS